MRAISLWQPWASAIVCGKKTVETRGWSTKYRGIVAIHAAQRWTKEQRAMCSRYLTVLFHEIPLGELVATAEIVCCVPTEQFTPHQLESVWGDYGAGRFAWVLDNIQPLEKPIPCKGRQGFFNVPDDLIYGSASIKVGNDNG